MDWILYQASIWYYLALLSCCHVDRHWTKIKTFESLAQGHFGDEPCEMYTELLVIVRYQEANPLKMDWTRLLDPWRPPKFAFQPVRKAQYILNLFIPMGRATWMWIAIPVRLQRPPSMTDKCSPIFMHHYLIGYRRKVFGNEGVWDLFLARKILSFSKWAWRMARNAVHTNAVI